MALVAKAPADQFYYADWLRDVELQMACSATRGIWMNALANMWFAEARGELTGTEEKLARLLNATDEDFSKFLQEAEALRFCYVSRKSNAVSQKYNADVTLRNRRMYREGKKRISNKLRQQRHRVSRKSNADKTPDVTHPSSSSPSFPFSSSNEEQEKPVFSEKKSGHFSDQIKDENIVEAIIYLCKWYEENLNTFNGWQFVQQNCKCHPQALVDVLRVPKYYIENGMVMRKGPWAIVNKILPSKIQNYNANDTIRAHKELTAQMEGVAPEIKEIASKLFGG